MIFITGVNAWWVYLAPQNIPSAIVLTLGNAVVLLCFVCVIVYKEDREGDEEWSAEAEMPKTDFLAAAEADKGNILTYCMFRAEHRWPNPRLKQNIADLLHV